MILVDFSQVVISNFMVELGGRKGVELSVPLLRHMILNSLRLHNKRYRNEFGEMIICCDSSHYWRRDFFPQYKGNRKEEREKSGIDWDTIFESIKMVKEEVHHFLPWRVVEFYGAEADDVIAALCEWSQTNDLAETFFDTEPKPVMIVSGDGDFVQLQKWKNIRQYSPILKKELKADPNKTEYILFEHIIRGDTGDGVPNLLSDDDCLIEKRRQKPVREKQLQAWFKDGAPEEHIRNFTRNKTLVDLSMIPESIKAGAVEALTSQPTKDRSKILNYFIANRMKNMVDVIGDF